MDQHPELAKGYGKMKTYVKTILKEHLDQSYGQVTVSIKYLEQLRTHIDGVVHSQNRQQAANLTWHFR